MSQHDVRSSGGTTHERNGAQSLVHRREFDAPAAAVQRAHTDPELFVRWMGPQGTSVRLDRFDPVTGGAFRYVVESAGGGAWAFRGSYHQVQPGSIVHTWEYEDEQGVTLEALTFVDLPDGRSRLEVVSTYTSEAACEEMVRSGLDAGMDENFNRLDDLLGRTG